MFFSSCHKHGTRQKKTFFLFLYWAQNLPSLLFQITCFPKSMNLCSCFISSTLRNCVKTILMQKSFFQLTFFLLNISHFPTDFLWKACYFPRKLSYPGRSTNSEISGIIWNASWFQNSPLMWCIYSFQTTCETLPHPTAIWIAMNMVFRMDIDIFWNYIMFIK